MRSTMPQVRAKVALRSEQACDAITIPRDDGGKTGE